VVTKRIKFIEGHNLDAYLRDTYTEDNQVRRLRRWLDAIKEETGDDNVLRYGVGPQGLPVRSFPERNRPRMRGSTLAFPFSALRCGNPQLITAIALAEQKSRCDDRDDYPRRELLFPSPGTRRPPASAGPAGCACGNP